VTGRLLIVNADDYALTAGVSRAILTAHRNGIVTSTSVLAVGPAFAQAAPALRDSGIGVGAHLAAVGEDPPLLSAAEIPTLVDRGGRLPTSWRALLPRVALGRIDLDDVRREFVAQLERIQGAGLELTHDDTHQHVHLWPGIADVVLDVARTAGVRAVRIIRSEARSPVGIAVRRFARALEPKASAEGFRYTAAATGLDEAGTLTRPKLSAAIDRLSRAAAASAELATHPGEPADADLDRYRWGYAWEHELAALTDATVRVEIERAGFVLGTYADLVRS
jgi:predicted glycoside hydrolase/deacetylase ChbG (UPF0249 family)